DDRLSFPGELCEDVDVPLRQFANGIQIADRDQCHSGSDLQAWNRDRQAMMLHDAKERPPQLMVVIIHERIDEVNGVGPFRQRRRIGDSLQELPVSKAGNSTLMRNSEQLLNEPSDMPLPEDAIGDAGKA